MLRKGVSVRTVLHTTVMPKSTISQYLRLPQEMMSLSTVNHSFLIISINVYGGH